MKKLQVGRTQYNSFNVPSIIPADHYKFLLASYTVLLAARKLKATRKRIVLPTILGAHSEPCIQGRTRATQTAKKSMIAVAMALFSAAMQAFFSVPIGLCL